MAVVVTQSIVAAGTTPSALTPNASDTVADASFGATGIIARVITTGTSTNVSVSDPGATASGNPGTVTPVACPSSGIRMIFIPRAAVNPSTGVATISFSGALTGVTYELYRI